MAPGAASESEALDAGCLQRLVCVWGSACSFDKSRQLETLGARAPTAVRLAFHSLPLNFIFHVQGSRSILTG